MVWPADSSRSAPIGASADIRPCSESLSLGIRARPRASLRILRPEYKARTRLLGEITRGAHIGLDLR
jgi:hypothetical protein